MKIHLMISQSTPHNQLAEVQNSSSIILLRHAQSQQNKAKKQMFESLSSSEHKISKQKLNDHPDYLSMKYAYKFLDAGLSQLGQQQAIEAGQKIREKWGNDIGGVVVSPLRRALQTTEKVLDGVEGVTVWVEPLLTEALHAACDIGSNITSLLARYGPKYNFQALDNSKWQNWTIQIMQNEELKIKIYKIAQDQKKDVYSVALEQMKNNKTLQTCEETRRRVKKLKQKLREYKQRIKKTKKLLIIGHYFMIKYMTCSKYKNDGMPENGIELWNAEAIEVNNQFLHYD